MNKSDWYEIGAVALGGAALFFILSRGGGQNATTGTGLDLTPPNYLTYNANVPDSTPGNNLAGVAQNAGYPGGGSQPGCSCGSSSQDLPAYSSVNDFANTLNEQLDGLATDYSNAILSQVPDYVSQYFNNQQAFAQATVAQSQFASLGVS